MKLLRTSQLNVGGNMDFYNMLERERLESKKISKTNAVTSIIDHELPADDVHVGPSDYVPWLTDRKWAHIRVEGQAFGDVPLNIELKLEVWDSPNSAGIVIDAVRCCKLALNNGIAGQLDGPSSYLMKSPLHPAPGPPRARGHRGLHRGQLAHPRRGRGGAAAAAKAAEEKSAVVDLRARLRFDGGGVERRGVDPAAPSPVVAALQRASTPSPAVPVVRARPEAAH